MDSPSFRRIALFGGIYSNYLALQAAVEDAIARGADALFALGDLGAFGPHPDRVFPILRDYQIPVVRGNYDDSIGYGKQDCQCGYTDPRDNHFAQISYDYTLTGTSPENRAFLRTLPPSIRVTVGEVSLHLCHGSPRRMNEFLWESTSSDAFLEYLIQAADADCVCVTHTGLKWDRVLPSGRRLINVGVLGRPENENAQRVWYTLITAPEVGSHSSDDVQATDTPTRAASHRPAAAGLMVDFVPVEYDHQRLASEMESERLPAEFIETIRTGWWTTCLEVLPSKERRRGRY